jgi:hypothetical protein
MPAPLNQLPWDVAKDQFGAQGADFIGVLGTLLLRVAKDQFRPYSIDTTALSGTLPPPLEKTGTAVGDTEARASGHAPGISSARPAVGAPASP